MPRMEAKFRAVSAARYQLGGSVGSFVSVCAFLTVEAGAKW